MLLPDAEAMPLEEALAAYAADGYVRLGRVLSDEGLARLRERADALMLGQRRYPGLFFQHDTETGRYEDLEYGKGWQGPSLSYRKLEKLELDDRFRALIENALFARIARAVVGDAVAIYRAVLMNKPAAGGTVLPFHQDAGRFWGLDRDPHLQIWTALDDAGLEGGCLEVVPGTHRAGLATPLGGLIPEAVVAASENEARTIALPARAGEAILIHNYVWHRSGRSQSGQPRRAFSVCYIDAATRCLRTRRAPRQFVRVF